MRAWDTALDGIEAYLDALDGGAPAGDGHVPEPARLPDALPSPTAEQRSRALALDARIRQLTDTLAATRRAVAGELASLDARREAARSYAASSKDLLE